jgi:hypothetical protein
MVRWLEFWIIGLLDYWIFGLGLNVYGLRIVVRRNGSRVWGPRCNRTLAKVLDTFSASAVAPSENTRTDIWIFGWLGCWILGLGLNVYGLRIVVRRNGSRVWDRDAIAH